jgi:hypothetical protein
MIKEKTLVAQLDLDNEAEELHKDWAKDFWENRVKKTQAPKCLGMGEGV